MPQLSFSQVLLSLLRQCLVLYPLLSFLVEAISINITVDDTNPAFTYEYGWVASPCNDCSAQLNQNLTYDGTWHDGGSFPGLTGQLNFTGTAVYLFGITSQNDTGGIDFTLDGKDAKPFDPSVGVPQVVHVYNFSFFAMSDLENGSHTLGFTTVLAPNSAQTVLIDYAVVTVDNSTSVGSSPTSPTSKSVSTSGPSSTSRSESESGARSSNKSGLIGGIVGGVAGAALLLLFVGCLLRRRKSQIRPLKLENHIESYPAEPHVLGSTIAPSPSSHKGNALLPVMSTPSRPLEEMPPLVTHQPFLGNQPDSSHAFASSQALPLTPTPNVSSPLNGQAIRPTDFTHIISEEDLTTPPPPY